ncbi:unnamed protein product [Cochlearia groenlandica]
MRLVTCLLGVSLLAVAFYGSNFPDSVHMFRVFQGRDRDYEYNLREKASFVFHVYHKLRAREIPARNLAQVLGVVDNSC